MAENNYDLNLSYFGNFSDNQVPPGIVNVRERVGLFQRTYQVNFNSLAETMAQEAKKILEEAKLSANSTAGMAFKESVKYTDRVSEQLDAKITNVGKTLTDYVNDISLNIYNCFTGIFDNLNKLQVDINNKLINLEKLINSKDEIIKTISKRLNNVEQLSNNNNKSLIDLKKNMKRDTEKKVDLGEHGVSDNMSFACDELGENYDDNIAEKNFKDDLFLENSMQKVYEDIIGNAQVDNENREKLYLLVIRQNQLQFKQIKRPLSEEEKGKYRASFKKITDQRGNMAYQIAQSCSDFNMEKYISSKLLTLKRNFRFNKANNGRNKEHFYTLRYNNK